MLEEFRIASTESLRKLNIHHTIFYSMFYYLYYKNIKNKRPKFYTERLHGTSHWQVNLFAWVCCLS